MNNAETIKQVSAALRDNKMVVISALRTAEALIDKVELRIEGGSLGITCPVDCEPSLREVTRSIICLGALTVSALPPVPDADFIDGTRHAAKNIAANLINSVEKLVLHVATNIQLPS